MTGVVVSSMLTRTASPFLALRGTRPGLAVRTCATRPSFGAGPAGLFIAHMYPAQVEEAIVR